MLDDRAKLLLKALVERYIAEGQPVGSRTLSRASGLELSPATIRNVMSDLEELGLIASPHTSAGRIPTARGYRLFVDTMLTAQRERFRDAQPAARPAAEGDRQRGAAAVQPVAVRRRGDGAAAHARCSATSSSCGCRSGASWSSSSRPTATCRTAWCSPTADYTQSQLVEAANYLNANYAGLAIEQVRERLKSEVEQLRGEIVRADADGGGGQLRGA